MQHLHGTDDVAGLCGHGTPDAIDASLYFRRYKFELSENYFFRLTRFLKIPSFYVVLFDQGTKFNILVENIFV